MARPRNESFNEAANQAQHDVWALLTDQEHLRLAVVRSKHVDHDSKVRSAAELLVIRAICDELNDSTSDIAVSGEDVKRYLAEENARHNGAAPRKEVSAQ